MSYEVILPRSVQKELNAISQKDHDRIISRLESLEKNPRPANVKKLKTAPRGELVQAIIASFMKSMTPMKK